MKVTFLGTGTSQGVPVIACSCAVCASADRRDNRLRTSVLIETEGKAILIDSGPDFRYQMLRAGVKHLDAILFTHGHKDHIAGLDDVRAFNYLTGKAMDIYVSEETQEVLFREFQYVFTNAAYPGVPQLRVHTIGNQPFVVEGLSVIPIRVLHYKMEVFGFRIGDFTYITDANYIPAEELLKITGSKILVINALRLEKHISHFTLEEAIAVASGTNVPTVYFTHISHQLGLHEEVSRRLPAGMCLAHDMLEVRL